MSFIVKGIDLPKEEEALGSKWRVVIHLAIDSNGLVTEQDSYGGWHRTNIQAIQIPKDHGRLIDGGALYKYFEDALDKNSLDDWWEAGAVLDNIELAPTILEAEGEE